MSEEQTRERLQPMTPEEVDALAQRVVTGEVFVAWTPQMFEASFGMYFALAAASLPKAYLIDAVSGWAEAGSAMPMAVNGMPQFFSCHLLTNDDLEELQRAVLVKSVAIGRNTPEDLERWDDDRAYWLSLVEEDPGYPMVKERERLAELWVAGEDVDDRLAANEAAMAEARGDWFERKWAERQRELADPARHLLPRRTELMEQMEEGLDTEYVEHALAELDAEIVELRRPWLEAQRESEVQS